ncbi:MAG: helix-turn-helix transcriptional regulator [Dehalococcoidia bacterium]
MHSTKSQMVAHLKRSGGSSVEELANALGLARMTIRQHLAALERDELVASHQVRRATGRPHYVFSLSCKGDDLFPRRYDRLADMLLQEVALLEGDEISGLAPDEKKRLILQRVVARLVREHVTKVNGKTLAERVAAVATILQQEGGFAEWREQEQGYEIIDYNCVYRMVAAAEDGACEWHLALLRQLLGDDVKCSHSPGCGAECCRFTVQAR